MGTVRLGTIRLRLLEAIPLGSDNMTLYPAGTTLITRTFDEHHPYEDLVSEGRMEVIPDCDNDAELMWG